MYHTNRVGSEKIYENCISHLTIVLVRLDVYDGVMNNRIMLRIAQQSSSFRAPSSEVAAEWVYYMLEDTATGHCARI